MVWNWPHIHLIVNHLPVIAVPSVLFFLAYAHFAKSESIGTAALLFQSVVSLGGAFVYYSGTKAEHTLEEMAIVPMAAVHHHHDAAFISLIALVVLAATGVVGLLFLRKRPEQSSNLVFATNALAVVVVSVILAWTANLGGKIRHTEIRQPGYLEEIKSNGHVHDHSEGEGRHEH